MKSLSEQLLAAGCIRQLAAVHGETVKILSGPDIGKSFIGIVESEPDLTLTTELGMDPRAKRVVRFDAAMPVPNIPSQAQVQTADGQKWNAVRQDFSGFLTVDFELKEIAEGIDT